MTEDYTYHGPALTGRHPYIGPMPADATVLQPAEMAALRASLAALEAALVEAEAERAQLVARTLAAEAQLAAVTAVTWIPAAERLPQPELRVLAVYSDDRRRMILRAIHIPRHTVLCYGDYEGSEYDEETDAIYYPGGWYEAVESGEYAFVGPLAGSVTHWAQLPALPEVQP